MREATPRAKRYLADLASSLAQRTGTTRQAVYEELGAYESTPWGPRARILTGPAASRMIVDLKAQLAALPPAASPA